MMHGERNALLQATQSDLSDCRLYITGMPCNDCFQIIIMKGIKKVIVGDIGHVFGDGYWEMHHFLRRTHGVEVIPFRGRIADPDNCKEIGISDESFTEQPCESDCGS